MCSSCISSFQNFQWIETNSYLVYGECELFNACSLTICSSSRPSGSCARAGPRIEIVPLHQLIDRDPQPPNPVWGDDQTKGALDPKCSITSFIKKKIDLLIFLSIQIREFFSTEEVSQGQADEDDSPARIC